MLTKVTHALIREHRVIERVLDDLEKALDPLDMRVIREAVIFLEERTRIHRRKEEEVFFPALARHLTVSLAPLETIEQEHATERIYLDEIRTFLAASREDPSMKPELVEACRTAIPFLRDHLWKEENFFLAQADGLLTEEEKRDVVARMEAIGDLLEVNHD